MSFVKEGESSVQNKDFAPTMSSSVIAKASNEAYTTVYTIEKCFEALREDYDGEIEELKKEIESLKATIGDRDEAIRNLRRTREVEQEEAHKREQNWKEEIMKQIANLKKSYKKQIASLQNRHEQELSKLRTSFEKEKTALSGERDNVTQQLSVVKSLRGLPEELYRVGNRHMEGAGIERNEEMGIQYYKAAAMLGHTESLFLLGIFHYKGKAPFIAKNFQKALDFFNLASEGGCKESCYYLGIMYENGEGVEKDLEIAAKHYKTAADSGHPLSQYNLATMYNRGVGVEKNPEKALKYFQLYDGNRERKQA